ncbi:lipoprotein BA_5634 family protein [Paenibacillus sp. 1001270B_150601_E10]|uniref:lipoprotein BA_5634 family protein n=1 Tax=Paenibacillus sp. 1001270B_150601_E10 TaxID=2787079 RepID=UPI00189C9FC9|nr:lipoprotein BA_5634 family protein [Paenibacillus sp. 1001270B_150601_E10]
MKDWKTIVAVLMIFTMVGTGCTFFEKANGVILYGTDRAVDNTMSSYSKDAKLNKKIPFKEQHTEKGSIMILSTDSAKELLEAGVLKQVKDKEKVVALVKASVVREKEGVLYAKSEVQDLRLDSVTLHYDGNCIIGDGRALVDMFAIVSNEDYAKMNGEGKTIGLLNVGKDLSAKLQDLSNQVEAVQLVTFE